MSNTTPPVSNRPGSAAPKRRTGLIVGIIIAVVVIIVAAIAVPQVIANNNGDNNNNVPDADAPAYTLVTPGTLTVATEGTYKPFSYHDETGELVGYDVEVSKAVAEKLGLEVKFQETEWAAIFAGLEGKRFDVIGNQVSINDEREAQYSLSDPYSVSPGALVVAADNTDITGFDQLSGKKAAQSATSNWFELATSYGADVEDVEGWNESVALLRSGRIDFTLNDKLTVLDYVATEKADDIKIVAETDDPSRSAFALTKDNSALTTEINTALAELSADGTLAEIGEKYFGADVSK
jgi:cystine transport system substrate-binding protein